MADEHDFTIGKMIETEINNFLQEFSQSRCGMHIPVLLFPIGLPPNVLRVIRYIAMLFDLVAIRVGPEGAQTLAIVHPHHLRQHIGYYFGYEDALYNTPYIYEEFRDMLKWSFIKFIESSQRNRTKYDSILRVMRKIPPNQTDEVSTSEDQSASDTSGYSRAEPGTSAGASQSILTYQTDDQEVSTMEDSDTSAYDQTLPSTSTNTTQIIPHNPTDDQAVLSSKDKSVSDTSADNPAEPGTSTGICEPTATASDGVVQNVPQNLPDIQEEYCSEEESVSGTSAYDPAEPSTSANDSELTTTTSTDTVQPRTLNAHAEEQQPALEPPRSSTPTWEDWVKMIPSRELIHEVK
ncbi:endochitinase A-like [Photinus pyralis]|uniref:endochitinase A-like n=1 Tax=Photinus pyralis TaxID=7054 RepID=UPI001266F84C|nr:endochitinase A-like [Photinus pyralis]